MESWPTLECSLQQQTLNPVPAPGGCILSLLAQYDFASGWGWGCIITIIITIVVIVITIVFLVKGQRTILRVNHQHEVVE